MESATMEVQTCVDGRSCRRRDGPDEDRTGNLRAQLLPLIVDRVHERRRGIDDSILRVSPAIQVEIAQEPIGLVLRGNVIGIRLQPIVCREEAREPVGILFGLLGVQIALFEKLAAGCRAKTADAEFLLRIGGAGVIHGERREQKKRYCSHYGSSTDHRFLLPSFTAAAWRLPAPLALRRAVYRIGEVLDKARRRDNPPRSARRSYSGDSQRDRSAGRIKTRNSAARTSARAVSTSQPTGSPRPIALASTPTTGIASVPTEMPTAGKRRTSLNHAQWQKSVPTMTE